MKTFILTIIFLVISIQQLYSRTGEIWFYIDDDQNDDYIVVARRISSNNPLFGINFMEVNTNLYDQVISDQIEPVNTWPPYDYLLGFDYLRDEGSIGWPLIGEGKLEFSIYLTSPTGLYPLN